MFIKKSGYILTIGLEYMDFIDEETYDKFNNEMVGTTYTRAFMYLKLFFDFGADGLAALESLDISRDVYRLIVEIEGPEGGYYFLYDNPAMTGNTEHAIVGGIAPRTDNKNKDKGRCKSIW